MSVVAVGYSGVLHGDDSHGWVKRFREKDWRPTVWEMKDKDAARSARSDMGSFALR